MITLKLPSTARRLVDWLHPSRITRNELPSTAFARTRQAGVKRSIWAYTATLAKLPLDAHRSCV